MWAVRIGIKSLYMWIYSIDLPLLLLTACSGHMNFRPWLYCNWRLALKSMQYSAFLDCGTKIMSTFLQRAGPWACCPAWMSAQDVMRREIRFSMSVYEMHPIPNALHKKQELESCWELKWWWLVEKGLASLWRSVWISREDVSTVLPCSTQTTTERGIVSYIILIHFTSAN